MFLSHVSDLISYSQLIIHYDLVLSLFILILIYSFYLLRQCIMHYVHQLFSYYYYSINACNCNHLLPLPMSPVNTLSHLSKKYLQWFEFYAMLACLFVTQCLIVLSQSLPLMLAEFNIDVAFGVVMALPKLFAHFNKNG